MNAPHSQPSSPAKLRVIQYSGTLVMEAESCGVLDTPLSRSMTVFAALPCARDDDPTNPHHDKFCNRKFSAVLANTCMSARRSAPPAICSGLLAPLKRNALAYCN